MLENKDQAIKLFGWTIQLGSNSDEDTMIGSKIKACASADVSCECTSYDENILCSKQSKNRGNEGCTTIEPMDMNKEDESYTSSSSEESKTRSTTIENLKTRSTNQDSSTQDLVQREDHSDQTSTTTQSDPQNPPKKPEEILPCPRCKSMNTKFCYFNNYNVNQPRHFCKNCQRYWTAGGCMRNVPVGSGRRKSKTSHSGFQPNSPTGPDQYWPMGPGSGDTTSSNGLMRPKMGTPMGSQEKDTSQGFVPPQMACYPTSNWPSFAWNPIPWQSGYPLPMYSPSTHPQWVCHFVPNPSICPNPNTYPFLGKHSRDGTLLVPSNNSNNEEPMKDKTPENPMPTTLRIVDDPIEVARSSVWGSLELEKDKARSSNNGGGFFRGFDQNQYKGIDPNYTSGEGSHLANQANPAAFCRSLSFHEVGEYGC